MSDCDSNNGSPKLESDIRDMKLEAANVSPPEDVEIGGDREEESRTQPKTSEGTNGDNSPLKQGSRSVSFSPAKKQSPTQSPAVKSEVEEVVGGDITVKLEPGKPPKLSRKTSQKIISRPPLLFLDSPDKTTEATSTFEVIPDCTYAAKYLGWTDPAIECDCTEEWDPATRSNNACGEDSDCINRVTKIECIGDSCSCGSACQNMRFQQKQYARVTVIKTDKKGYGLRADADLRKDDFIFEYIGEVINEPTFERRMHQYDKEGIKHFYFMSLNKGEFVDATKKGNLGRFCNHSCNPNCYVDKWVVGEKLRMGIFADRNIKAGEELVFNYNVDRYGADPQPCYCGEPNCTGYIGGKTQTERATKLSTLTIEALGIEDGEGWDTAVAKKPRKKKMHEDDEEYVANVKPKALDEAAVNKVIATLRQCKEKWIVVKLLSRIDRADDERVIHRFVRAHGYQVLKFTLTTFEGDHNIALQVLDILFKFPRLSRNKIQDSKIEETVEKLKTCGDERVESKSTEILDIWSKLTLEYRIPRIKRDANAAPKIDSRRDRPERRERTRSRTRSRSRSVDAPRGPSAPAGPRGGGLPRGGGYYNGPRPPFRRPPFNPLPPGWSAAQSADGKTYYYSATGQTTWERPTMAAAQPPPPPKEKTHEQRLQEIIEGITKNSTPKDKGSASGTPQSAPTEEPKKEKKDGKGKWRSYPEEKQKKLYENTLQPHIVYVMNKFKHKLPKDELKRFTKECAKKLVSSDYKHKRVEDPTKISSKQERIVKKYVKEYLDKAVHKKREMEKRKVEKKAKEGMVAPEPSPGANALTKDTNNMKNEDAGDSDDDMMDYSDGEDGSKKEDTSPTDSNPNASPALKRKREGETPLGTSPEDDDIVSMKKLKTHTPPPPPPPPPPAEGPEYDRAMSLMESSNLTPSADGYDSFHAEAQEAVRHAVESRDQQIVGEDNDQRPSGLSHHKNKGLDVVVNGHRSPLQLATPPNAGSYELQNETKIEQQDFERADTVRIEQDAMDRN